MIVRVDAPAKVNLTLEVIGRRPDGFHDLRSVMHAISLLDHLTFAPAPALHLSAGHPELEGPHNLVWRAAELLRRESGTSAGAAIAVRKDIPLAAGLGGGSSDAAAALLGLERLWNLGLSRARLLEFGSRLGSDVPFFLGPSACSLAEGRGERLTPLPPLVPCWAVLLTPDVSMSTAAVFRAFPRERWGDGSRTSAWLAQAAAPGDPPLPFNDLEPVALQLVPSLAGARDALLAAGAPFAAMSGSGATYFTLCDSPAAAMAIRQRLPPDAGRAHVAHLLPRLPPVERSPAPLRGAGAGG
jgi:4-diphosphocytidyl-2-C-methyl-D-erythritol kinase